MSIVSYQSGSITLADATASVTLGTTVTQGNSILIVSLRGGSNSVGQYNVRVTLSSDGTTVTATRATSGPDIIIEYQVIEASEFTVQHFETTIAAYGSHSQAITSVDADYAFPICTGLSASGGSRGSDDFVSLEITTATNVNLEIRSDSSVTVAFQVVEMSSSEIASVQAITTTLAAVTNNVTIASVDAAKSLLFATSFLADNITVRGRQVPVLELTSSTNLQLRAASHSTANMTVIAYVVEFVNLDVTSTATSGITGTTTTEVLGAAPTYGGAVINALTGRYSSASINDDDSREEMFTADLSGSTWTFERAGTLATAEISYSVFDWADVFASGGISAQLDIALSAASLNAAGTIDTAAIFDQALGAVTTAADAAVDIDAAADSPLEAVSLGASSGVQIEGLADLLLADVAVSADGNVVTGVVGALDVTLGELVVAALSTVDIDALLAVTLDGAVVQGVGAVDIQGVSDITLADIELTGSGIVVSGVGAALDIVLDQVAVAAAGTVDIAGSADIGLDQVAVDAQTAVDIVAALDGQLDSAQLSALASLGSNISAAADITLDEVIADGIASVEIVGQLTTTLDGVSTAALGNINISGYSAITLGDAALAAAGISLDEIQGGLAIALDDIVLDGLVVSGLIMLVSPVSLDIQDSPVSIDLQCWDIGINFYK